MITRAEIEKLGAMHAVEPAIVSLYLAVPPHPAPLLDLLAGPPTSSSPRPRRPA